jgi:carboxymethylenebutenolidase
MEKHDDAHELAHLYVDGAYSRRQLMSLARKVAGGMAAVTVALTEMGVPLKAETPACPEDVKVPADAEDIEARDVEFAGDESPLFGYLVKPKRESTDPLAAVIVIHENRGLVEHIRDVTRRVARAGYVALGIDLLSRQGGTSQFTTAGEQTGAYGRTTPAGRVADLRKAAGYLRLQPDVKADFIGSVGFCAGGANVWALAVSGEAMQASVVYYGAPAPAAEIENLQGALHCHYAELDRNLSTSSAAAIPALIAARKTFGYNIWEGVGHAFNNDTGAAYNAAVACEAWTKTLAFFNRHLNKPVE